MEITKLNLKPINDSKCILKADYIYSINGFLITVPKGFITDGASIPKSLQWIYDPYGKYIKAAVIHDYLYSKYNDTGINRTLADKIFDFIMKETGVNAKTRRKFYVAVKYFGKIFWQDKLKNDGYIDRAVIDRTKEAREYYRLWNNILKL
jgi:hypothetical protein